MALDSRIGTDEFVDIYVSSVLEAIPLNDSLDMNVFYTCVFEKVSERTGLSKEEVKHLHHAFHWDLFLRSHSPFEIFSPKEKNKGYHVKIRNSPPERYGLVSSILLNYRTWIEKRLENLKPS